MVDCRGGSYFVIVVIKEWFKRWFGMIILVIYFNIY